VTLHALEAHPDVGLNGFDDVAEMQRPVGIGQCTRDEDLAGQEKPGFERAREYKSSQAADNRRHQAADQSSQAGDMAEAAVRGLTLQP
jgi:hypothetical protein